MGHQTCHAVSCDVPRYSYLFLRTRTFSKVVMMPTGMADRWSKCKGAREKVVVQSLGKGEGRGIHAPMKSAVQVHY